MCSILKNRKNRRVSAFMLLSCLLTGVLVASSTAMAQSAQSDTEQQQDSSAEQASPPASGMSREQLLGLIANEVVLAPGVGLRNVRLGEPIDTVRSRLGPPSRITRSGFTNKDVNLIYTLDQGTVVVFSGRTTVRRISVSGTSRGLVRTNRGVRFGMNSELIQRIYGEPTKTRRTRLEYRQLGVTFYLTDDRLDRIDLYLKRS